MALYGKQKQLKRVAIYNDFCKKTEAVLFATDIAARGLGEYLFCFFFLHKTGSLLTKRSKGTCTVYKILYKNKQSKM